MLWGIPFFVAQKSLAVVETETDLIENESTLLGTWGAVDNF